MRIYLLRNHLFQLNSNLIYLCLFRYRLHFIFRNDSDFNDDELASKFIEIIYKQFFVVVGEWVHTSAERFYDFH